MTITLKTGLHLTATNKRHISELLEGGFTAGGTKALQYRILARDGADIRVLVAKRERDSSGRAFWRKNVCDIAVSEAA